MKGSKHLYTPACAAILVFTGFHARVNLMVLFLSQAAQAQCVSLSNDPGKVDSNFSCYFVVFTQRMHKPT